MGHSCSCISLTTQVLHNRILALLFGQRRDTLGGKGGKDMQLRVAQAAALLPSLLALLSFCQQQAAHLIYLQTRQFFECTWTASFQAAPMLCQDCFRVFPNMHCHMPFGRCMRRAAVPMQA